MLSEWIKWVGLIAGLVFGGSPLVSASWVWFRKQILGPSGGVLLSAGVVVLVVNLAAFGDWQFVSLEGEGVKLELRRAAERIKQLEAEVASLNQMKEEFGASNTQLASLQRHQEEIEAIARQAEDLVAELKPAVVQLIDRQSQLSELETQVRNLKLEKDALTRATASLVDEMSLANPSGTKQSDFAKTYGDYPLDASMEV